MKQIGTVLFCLLFSISAFAEKFNTGDALRYYPIGAPQVANQKGDVSNCFVSEISKAVGYPEGIYRLTLISSDWVCASTFAVPFTYIVKKGTVIDLIQKTGPYSDSIPAKFTVTSVSDNSIEVSIALNLEKTEPIYTREEILDFRSTFNNGNRYQVYVTIYRRSGDPGKNGYENMEALENEYSTNLEKLKDFVTSYLMELPHEELKSYELNEKLPAIINEKIFPSSKLINSTVVVAILDER